MHCASFLKQRAHALCLGTARPSTRAFALLQKNSPTALKSKARTAEKKPLFESCIGLIGRLSRFFVSSAFFSVLGLAAGPRKALNPILFQTAPSAGFLPAPR